LIRGKCEFIPASNAGLADRIRATQVYTLARGNEGLQPTLTTAQASGEKACITSDIGYNVENQKIHT
jgi:hypothetical protein